MFDIVVHGVLRHISGVFDQLYSINYAATLPLAHFVCCFKFKPKNVSIYLGIKFIDMGLAVQTLSVINK